MGVPKRKVSKSRKGERRAHLALRPTLVECDHCHELKRAHRVPDLRLAQRPRGGATAGAHPDRVRPLTVGPMRIAVDAMGGDLAPREIVGGPSTTPRATPMR